MARTAQRVNYNTFQAGKVSDSNPINPPENAVRTLLNVDVELNGKIGRRLGLEPEDNFNLPVDVNNGSTAWLDGYTLAEIQASGIDVFVWRNVDNRSGINYRVVRIRNTLYVYDEGGTVLSNSLVQTVDISGYATTSTDSAAEQDFQAISGKGLLICSGSEYELFYIKYNFSTDTWSNSQINIQIRDFEGLDDGLEPDENPTTLSNEHLYNLYNQGWPSETVRVTESGAPLMLAHQYFFQRKGDYPSNSEIWYFGNRVAGNFIAFDPDQMDQYFGNTLAPRGHFIINAFDGFSRQTVSGLGLSGLESTTRRPRAVAFFAGRVWYASVSGVIYFSKIIESERDLGKCYQEQDPTAEGLNELLDTDGGTLKILDMGEAEGLAVLGDSLVVLGTNGVWAVSGGDTGFTANNQLLYNISKVKVSSYKSVVTTENAVFFWAEEGVYVLSPNEIGKLSAISLSENRIQRDYNAIPAVAKSYAQGMYDRVDRKIYWCYSFYNEDSTADIKHKYTDVMVYSIPLNSFWDYHLTNEGFDDANTDYPIMCGMFPPNFRSDGESEENVTADTFPVTLFKEDISSSTWTDDLATDTAITVSPTANGGPYRAVFINSISKYVAARFAPTNPLNDSGSIHIISSSDGKTWDLEATLNIHPTTTSNFSGSIAYSESLNRIVFLNGQGFAYTTPQALTSWTTERWNVNHGASVPWVNMSGDCIWNEESEEFIAVPLITNASNGDAIVSSDGITWTAVGRFPVNTLFYNSIIWSPNDSLYIWSAGASTTARVYTSPTGVTWTLRYNKTNSAASCMVTDMAINPTTGRVVAVGTPSASSISRSMYSDDGGVTWSTEVQIFPASPNPINVFAVTWSPLDERYIAAGQDGATAYSLNGESWTVVNHPSSGSSDVYSVHQDVAVVEAVTVDDGAGGDENVTVGVPFAQFAEQNIKCAMLLPDSTGELRLTFGQYSARFFEDWDSLDAASLTANTNYSASFPVASQDSGDYLSIVETLPQTLGEPSIQKQATYLHTYYDYVRGGYNELEISGEFDGDSDYKPGVNSSDLTVDHGIQVRAKWDWTTSSGTGRWSNSQQGIKPRRYSIPTSATDPRNDGFGVLKSRLKIRGKGESLVIRFESESNKDFQLLGWTIPYEAETED